MKSFRQYLLESPYLHVGSMKRPSDKMQISDRSIKRDFHIIGSIKELQICISGDYSHVIGVNPNTVDKDDMMDEMFRLRFKSKLTLNFKHSFSRPLQVDSVITAKTFLASGYASDVYKLLVDIGFTVISDDTQFDPGRGIWLKLARDKHYKVLAADIDSGLIEENGKPVIFDVHKLESSNLWSSGSDYSGHYKVLILTK